MVFLTESYYYEGSNFTEDSLWEAWQRQDQKMTILKLRRRLYVTSIFQFNKHKAGDFYSQQINSFHVTDQVPKESLDLCATVP